MTNSAHIVELALLRIIIKKMYLNLLKGQVDTLFHGAGKLSMLSEDFNRVKETNRMLQNGQEGPNTRSYFPLTSLRLPVEDLVALLDVPPKASLHVPISMTLRIRNYHPTRSANITVHLEPDSLDSFVVSGMRTGRVPVLLPGAEEKLIWRMIPLECGYVKLPRIKVIDRRRAISAAVQSSGEVVPAPDAPTGDSVKVIGLRHDIWPAQADSERGSRTEYEGLGTILVLP